MKITNMILVTFVICCSGIVMAKDKGVDVNFKDLKKVSLKCYIELVGGKNIIIRHHNLPERDRHTFESKLLQNGIEQGNKTYPIYKVKECVELDKKFTDSLAERLFEDDIR